MHRTFIGFLCVLALSLPLVAAPQVQPGAIVNGASFAVSGAPHGAIAQGSLFSVFGVDVGPTTAVKALEFPLPTRLGEVTVKVTAQGRQFDCILLYASSTQVSGILPSDVPVGTASLVLFYGTASTKPIEFTVAARSFGMFSRNSTGAGLSLIQNYISPDNQPANGLGESALPGQIEVLWGTGLGASLNADDRNPPAPGNLLNLDQIKVYVGGKEATVQYAGRSGCCSGVDQVNFVVPAGVEGCFVPVFVTVAGVPSNFTTMAVASTPGICEGAFGLSKQDLEPLLAQETIRTGYVSLHRTRIENPFFSFSSDSGLVKFAEFTQDGLQNAGQNLVNAALPVGTCMVTNFRHDAFKVAGKPVPPDPLDLYRVRELNAGGVMTVTGPLGYRFLSVSQGSPGTYQGSLTGGPNPLQTFLLAGPYTIGNGVGGNDIGQFTFTKNVASFDPWTNRAAITTVPRSQSLTITWEPGLNVFGVVAISAQSLSVPKKVASSLTCYAAALPGSFTIPAYILSAMVESDTGPLMVESTGSISFSGISRPARFEAPGIDLGIFSSSSTESKEVQFQ